MRFLRFELAVVAVCCASACARPTIDETEPDDVDASDAKDAGRDPERDTGVAPTGDDSGELIEPPPARDSGQTGTPPTKDAGSGTDDDAGLPPALYNCEGVAPGTNIAVGSGQVTSVTMDNMNTTLKSVHPGDQVAIQLTVTLGTCGTFGVPVMYVGVDGDTQCTVGGVCSEVSLPSRFMFTVTAPQELGLPDVLASLGPLSPKTSQACTGTSTTTPETRIAALCVTPR